ncbi:ribonuclease T2-like protein [Leucosporidium creatinivorum]|uniref:Ribonuclease T2-like n=1 Tax=Leucosporidium creatinivorum TaxID=106004 RepID=A0A1Y2FZZ1_9BASI|nr:ribonuclease T2-like protein [Leucosporidium creatinivorum]
MLALLHIAVALPLAAALPTSLDRRAAETCPASSPLSCPTPSGSVDTCCTNSPGGQMLLTQFWDTNPVTGPTDSWTIHGLWPDHCDGTYDSTCDSSRVYTNISAILSEGGAQSTLDYMNVYWKDYNGDDESFHEHEWSKHGTCISTLDPDCYSNYQPQEEVVDFFEKTVELFKQLPTYDWLSAAGIVPSNSKTYTLAQLQAVAKSRFGQPITWGCRSGVLNEAHYGYYTRGNVVSGEFIPADVDKSTCPSTGIKYVPKTGGGSSTSTTSAPGSTSTAPSGKVFVNVISGSSTKGCLISTGKWMIGATCAGYTVSGSGSSITLTTSKGSCGIVSGAFTCGSGVSATNFSKDSSGNLVYSSNSQFHASAVPSGTTQVSVVTGTAAQSIKLNLA